MFDALLQPHSVRVFPKNKGADAYEASGISALCDWVVFSDQQQPQIHVKQNTTISQPKTIFLSLRNAQKALRYFRNVILPTLDAPFVLITGSEDVTLPSQLDCRFPAYGPDVMNAIREIAASPTLIHWFAENLDDVFSEHISPLPTGMVYPDATPPAMLFQPTVPPLSTRPLQVLCGNRIRQGDQWSPRRHVAHLVDKHWQGFTTHLAEEIPEEEFLKRISLHSFVLCVEGGGLDPSPKAWQTLQYGAIPIFRKTPNWEAYRELPCVVVDDWTPESISMAKLAMWKESLTAEFDDREKRAAVFEKLSLGYWWQKILSTWEMGQIDENAHKGKRLE